MEIDNGLVIKWVRDSEFTIKFCTNSDEERSILLDAMRDRTKIKVSIRVGDEE